MAQQDSLRRIEDQITCSVCLEPYREPKKLQCSHVFCRPCLEKLVSLQRPQQGGQPSISCPNCRKATPIPDGGIVKLEAAFYINDLVDIWTSLKSGGSPQVSLRSGSTASYSSLGSSLGTTSSASLDSRDVTPMPQQAPRPPEKPKSLCPRHEGEELQLYCDTCEEVICYDCTIKDHNGHKYDKVR